MILFGRPMLYYSHCYDLKFTELKPTQKISLSGFGVINYCFLSTSALPSIQILYITSSSMSVKSCKFVQYYEVDWLTYSQNPPMLMKPTIQKGSFTKNQSFHDGMGSLISCKLQAVFHTYVYIFYPFSPRKCVQN